MKKILLKYHQRLGDVIRVLAMARSLSEKGWEVYIECLPEYHSIFKVCPYAQAVSPNQKPPPGFKFDVMLDLEIWPSKYHSYRSSQKKWWDFVTGLHPLLKDLKWRNPFVDPFPSYPVDQAKLYCVVANCGFSQVPRIDPEKVEALAKKLYPNLQTICLGVHANHGKGTYLMAADLSHLVGLIKNAGAVVTINTAVTYIADAVREKYDHIVETGNNGQDDFKSDKQKRHIL